MKHLLSSIEPLESRIAPAALGAKLLAGVLTITGDPASPTVSIIQTGNSIEVRDGATSLNTFTGVKSIDCNLVGGAAINLALAGDGLAGPCQITAHGASLINVVVGSHLNGGLTVTGDVDMQTLAVGDNVVVGKSLAFKGGGGLDTINLGNGDTIGGNLALVSVEAGNFNANSVATAIAGSLTVNNTGDQLSTAIQTTTPVGLAISGGIRYLGGMLNDNLFLAAAVTKGVTFVDPAGTNTFGFGSSSAIHGSVSMTGGVGSDAFNMRGGTIDGNVTVNLGGGSNAFAYGFDSMVTIGGNLNVTAGSGTDNFQGFSNPLTVGKNVSVNLGGGINIIFMRINVFGTSLAVTTGSGVDSVDIEGMGTSVAAVIALGAGNDSLVGSFLGTVQSATLDGGAGTDHLSTNTFVADPIVIRSFEDFS